MNFEVANSYLDAYIGDSVWLYLVLAYFSLALVKTECGYWKVHDGFTTISANLFVIK